MKWIFKNHFSVWFKYTLNNKKYEHRYKSEKLKIGYMSKIHNVNFGNYNRVFNNCVVKDSKIGDMTFIAENTQIARTKIGKFCSIGPSCRIGLGNHPSKTFVSTHPAFYSNGAQFLMTFSDDCYFDEFSQIEIGNDVWIGANVTMIGDIKIGNGAIIAAGAVVTKDVPDYAIVGGVPAKIIRYRFGPNEITHLLKIQWWNLDFNWLRSNFKKFHNVNEFLQSEDWKNNEL